MSPIAIITGITGQTGSYLAELLLQKNYEVHGTVRRSSNFNTQRINHIYDKLHLHYADLSDPLSISNLLSNTKPALFFNLGAQSHVKVSFDIPEYTFDVTATGVIRALEAIHKHSPDTRFIQASSSEMFGAAPPPQSETTRFQPRSPYAVAKVAAFYATVNYRESYNMFAANSIFNNTESTRRGETFVTRKITRAATRIKLGLQDKLVLGNLDAKRDWGHAKDYANAMFQIITADTPDDYVIATGKMHSVREFAELAFSKLNLNYKDYVVSDPKYFRPAEVDALQGDYSKIKNALGWEPSCDLEQLVNEMVESDLLLAKQEKLISEIK